MKKSAEKCRFLLNKGGESVKFINIFCMFTAIIINFIIKNILVKLKNI